MISEIEINKKYFLNKVRDNPTILDVGCYDGSDSREFADLFKSSIIYCFDGDKRSVELFNKLSKEHKNIKLVETILADTDGETDWFESKSETKRHYDFQNSWSASSSIKKPDNHLNLFKNISFSDAKKIKSTKLDTWIEDNPQIDIIDIMWVDVNGGEEEFLNGAKRALEKTKFLYIEFSGVKNKKLYKNCFTKDEIKNKLPNFKEEGVYNFMGNFGNVLLKNNRL